MPTMNIFPAVYQKRFPLMSMYTPVTRQGNMMPTGPLVSVAQLIHNTAQ